MGVFCAHLLILSLVNRFRLPVDLDIMCSDFWRTYSLFSARKRHRTAKLKIIRCLCEPSHVSCGSILVFGTKLRLVGLMRWRISRGGMRYWRVHDAWFLADEDILFRQIGRY